MVSSLMPFTRPPGVSGKRRKMILVRPMRDGGPVGELHAAVHFVAVDVASVGGAKVDGRVLAAFRPGSPGACGRRPCRPPECLPRRTGLAR